MSDRETLEFEHQVLTASNRTLEAKLALVTAERDRLKATLAAIEQSRPWRLTQALRGLLGRRW
ncbi:MAG TPA: hypothetical protein VKB93_13370 [Thermoanaerobaculia bacterium]|nr:hypothetical protein [Thermoanaerobaculia bacterium]